MDEKAKDAPRETDDSIQVMYVFADVEGFTSSARTNEAQGDIIGELNKAFREATRQFKKTIFLPTGDGICAGITDPKAPYDAHLIAAIAVLTRIQSWSAARKDTNRACRVRLGINEAKDYPVKDINRRRNLAGAGINLAQRMMSLGDGNQIIASERAYATLRARDKYAKKFREFKAEIKHGQILTAYQFTDPKITALNVEVPTCLTRADSTDVALAEAINRASPEGQPPSWQAIRQAYAHAIEARLGEAEETFQTMKRQLSEKPTISTKLIAEQNKAMLPALIEAQKTWLAYFADEKGFIKEVNESFMAVSDSKRIYEIVRERTRALKEYQQIISNDADRMPF